MSDVQVRFHVSAPNVSIITQWENEVVRYGAQAPHTAVSRVEDLRLRFPDAAIKVERRGEGPRPKPVMFRYRIFVKEGAMTVCTPDEAGGVGRRELKNAVLLSRPFQEAEREKILADIFKMFPNAEVQEVKP